MLDTHARKYVNPIIEVGAKFFLKLKLTPNNVTVLALFIGVLSAVLFYFDKSILAVSVLWISGYLDAVDGQMARISGKTSEFGTLMDITFDRIVELAIIVSVGIKFGDVRINLIMLLCSIIISMVIFLTVGALAQNKGIKSFYYQAGVAERSEGFIMFSLMMIFTPYIGIIINLFTIMIGITIFQRAFEAKRLLS